MTGRVCAPRMARGGSFSAAGSHRMIKLTQAPGSLVREPSEMLQPGFERSRSSVPIE